MGWSATADAVDNWVYEDVNTTWLFWFLCGNEVYTDSFFDKIVLKVLPDKHFTIP
jgi:cobalamin biosynthesis Mg chelatase CobN